jgi:phosphatidylserine synthase 2
MPKAKKQPIGSSRSTSVSPVQPDRRDSAVLPSKKNTIAVDYSNEMMTHDQSVNFLYKPHSITAMILCLAYVTYEALFVPEGMFTEIENIKRGIVAACIVFCVIGLLVFPSGPFTRPHPALWRFVFAISVLYLMGLILILFMDLKQARQFLTHLDPTLNQPMVEKAYAEHCELNWENFSGALFDRFVISHFLGWLVQSMLIRHRLICWIVSISWELIEISLTHQLANFAECWWDQWILDVLICNGLGIEAGYQLCNYLEVQEYKWSGLMTIPTLSGKVTRIVAQFTTPESWTKVRWEPWRSVKRFVAANLIIIAINLGQLNSFYLKYLLWVPSENHLNIVRLLIMSVILCPMVRQVYLYVARKDVERIGSQTWVLFTILAVEVLIILKFGRNQFTTPAPEFVWKMWAFDLRSILPSRYYSKTFSRRRNSYS